ncbi:MAG TPA: hypothetical protein DCY13_08245 [Verrucomicrobiales bacterium]|nr:hypothetical protein [Verrucomicrobiales bacterium]
MHHAMDDLLLDTVSGRITSGLAGRPLLSSEGRPWGGFLVREQGPTNVRAREILLLKHLVCLQLEQPAVLEWQGDERSVQRTILPGQICVFPAHRVHSGSYRHTGRYIAVHLEPAFMIAASESLTKGPHPELRWELGIDSAPLRELVMLLHGEAGRSSSTGAQYATAAARLLAMHLLQHHSVMPASENPRGGLTPARLNRVVELIRNHLDERLTLRRLAARAGLSTFHFSRVFRQSTGMSPFEFVMSCRIKRAKELLLRPGARIGEVALQCGFCDQAHLTRNFKGTTGITPAEYVHRAGQGRNPI